jgi:outer membrane protein assembly factor BamB
LRGLSAPLIIGGRVYLGLDNGKLATVNLADGQTVWEQAISVPTGRADFDRLTDLDADLLPADDGLFVVTYGGDLALIDLGSGDSRWRRSIKSYSGMSAGAGKLFVTDDDGVVWALDADTGAVAWKNEDLKYRHLSAPVFCNGAVGVADFQGYVHWLNAANGTLAGRGKLGGKPVIVPPVAVDDTAYFLDVAGNLEALQPLPVTP